MRFLYFLMLFLFSEIVSSQPYPTKIWDKRIGSNEVDQTLGLPIKYSKDGNLLFAGQSVGGISGDILEPGKGSFDYWLFKADTLGNLIWSRGLGTTSWEVTTDFIELTDGGYVILGHHDAFWANGDKTENGRGSVDIWLIRLDSSLNIVWDKTLGGSGGQNATGIIELPDKSLMIAGSVKSTPDFDVTQPCYNSTCFSYDYWLVKLDNLGNKLWDRRYGWDQHDICHAIMQCSDGNFLLTGITYSSLGGDISTPNMGGGDYWVIKVDTLGNKIWDKRYGSSGSDDDVLILSTQDSGFLLGGRSSGNISYTKTENSRGNFDYWLVKCDSAGNVQWDKTLGGSNGEILLNTIQTTDGGYLCGGGSTSPASGDKTQNNWSSNGNMWIVKLSAVGTKQWDVRWGADKGESAHGLLSMNNGSFLAYGNSLSNIFGNKTQNNWSVSPTNTPLTDLWLINFMPPPTGSEEMGDSKNNLDVFPNPFQDVLEIGAEFTSAGKVQIEIFDITGRKVFENTYAISTPFFNKEIELGFLPAGVYSLAVTTALERRTRLVMKK